jgi:competence protein ComEA
MLKNRIALAAAIALVAIAATAGAQTTAPAKAAPAAAATTPAPTAPTAAAPATAAPAASVPAAKAPAAPVPATSAPAATTPEATPPSSRPPKTKIASGSKKNLVNLNAATAKQLKALPGGSDAEAARIIAGRPYDSKAFLLSKNVVNAARYEEIKALIVAGEPAKPAAAKK